MMKSHVAFIVDGNGRWATAKNLPRIAGHEEGIKRLYELIENLKDHSEISCLSFFLFSLENWKRSEEEVSFLMHRLEEEIPKFEKKMVQNNLRFFWTGFETNLSTSLTKKLKDLMNLTKNNTGIIINFVFNYGGMQDIIQACQSLKDYPNQVTKEVFQKHLLTKDLPEVDLMIRTSGEERISNYLLFQCAYAEFVFEPTKWPDYTIKTFTKNWTEFKNRDRRKGGYSTHV